MYNKAIYKMWCGGEAMKFKATKEKLQCFKLITRDTLSKNMGHMVGLNMISSLIHSGANLSSVPRD
jgi:hypothetical protein